MCRTSEREGEPPDALLSNYASTGGGALEAPRRGEPCAASAEDLALASPTHVPLAQGEPAQIRACLLAHRWRQGAVLPAALLPSVRMMPFASENNVEGSRAIVISQDCDVVHGDFSLEPAAEVIFARPLPNGVERRHQQLRDPRRLHLVLNGPNGPEAVSVSPWERGAIERSMLLEYAPDESVGIAESDLNHLVNFVARRYDRDAFPEEFARRFCLGFQKLQSLFRTNSTAILQIYLDVSPMEELGAYLASTEVAQPHYGVEIVVLVTDVLLNDRAGLAAFKSQAVNAAVRAIRVGCSGVDLENVQVIGADDLTVARASRLRRVDLASEKAIVADRAAASAAPVARGANREATEADLPE